MKKKFYVMLLITCISIVGVKAQNHQGYESPCPSGIYCPGYVGMVAYGYYNLLDDEFVFDQNLRYEITEFILPFASISVSGSHLRFTISKYLFKEEFINYTDVKRKHFHDVNIRFKDKLASPSYNDMGATKWGYIRIMFPEQP